MSRDCHSNNSSRLKYLVQNGLSIDWLIEQRHKYHMPYEKIALILNISTNTVRRLCDDLGILSENSPMPEQYSNTQLLSVLEEAYDELVYINKARYDKWAQKNKKPRAITIDNRFLSFEAALKMIGKNSEYNYEKWSDSTIKHHLSLLVEHLGCAPSESDIDDYCPFSHSVLEHRFGGIQKTLEAFKLSTIKTITCVDCDAVVKTSKYASRNQARSIKRCSKCQLAKKLSELEAWADTNREHVEKKSKEWYWENREYKLSQHKSWYDSLKQKLGISDATLNKTQNMIAGIINEIYPTCTIVQEKTWPWLINPETGRHLWVDIYVPEMRLVVEFNGRYHYEVVPPFTKNENELKNRQKRDEVKKKLCEQNGLRFITIPYTVGISKSKIYSLLHTIRVKMNSHVEEFGIPYNRKAGDIGFDLHASHDMSIAPNQHVNIGTEIYLDMPYDIYASILLRSSMARKGLMTHQSLLDPGYRGEFKVMVWNFSQEVVNIIKGERIAQILFSKRAFVSLVPVFELSKSERGTQGYGSTGIN